MRSLLSASLRPALQRLLWSMVLGVTVNPAAAVNAATTSEPQKLQFPSLDRGTGGQPVLLDGYLYQPPAQTIHAAVVMLHGCAGALKKSGNVSQRFEDMAQLLTSMGYAVLLVDSFHPRNTKEICTTPPKQRSITEKERRLDAYGALHYLQTRSDISANRIGAIGFSHGATAALDITDSKLRPAENQHAGFAAVVAMYPGCFSVLKRQPQFKAYAPLLIQSGELDDWTPAKYCRQLAQRSQSEATANDKPVEFVSYSGAYHGFDETTPVHVRTDVRHGINGAAGTHVGGNPVAREQAYARIRSFFATYLTP